MLMGVGWQAKDFFLFLKQKNQQTQLLIIDLELERSVY